MNFAMWKKALTVIPNVSKGEWDKLDIISKWLISTRAAVLIMTFLSAVLAGLFAWHDGYKLNLLAWFILALGLVLAHAANNIFNDYTDYTRGVDKDNYYRTMYGPQPVADGLLTKSQHLFYFAVTGLLAVACGIYLVLMVGGGYYVLTHTWSWNVVWASTPYVLGVTTVILGKHIDKLLIDKAKRIFTLPVIIGEKAARYAVLTMMAMPYLLVASLIITRYFTPVLLLVLVAVPTFIKMYPQFLKPKPETRPEGFPDGQGGWPLYFASQAFVNNRAFGVWFMLAMILDVIIRVAFPSFWAR
jgi:1,4-dihydroxy-2-naphthoate octaprenyltransferase